MPDWVIQLLCSLAVLVVVAVAYHYGPQTIPPQTAWWIPHAVAAGSLVLICVLLPTSIATFVFSPLTTVLMGTVFPIYESVRAVCTPLEDDDKAWLQYWMVGGVLFMCTEWIGRAMSENRAVYWDEAFSLFFVWLFYPLTNGAKLVYVHVTKPYIGPHVKPLATKMDNMITALYQLMMNALHLWVVWIIFIFLPAGLKRTVAVLVGTFYPLVSSIVAASTEEVADDTYWLTYWSVYGCLFLIMELLETFLGKIPGFYTLVILATVYLMLPMFQGADKVFRKVLVPLSGLQEMLMLRDAIQVKKQMLHDLNPQRARVVRQAIAKFYASDEATTVDPMDLAGSCKTEYLKSWSDINPFRSNSSQAAAEEGAEPNETTSLV